MNYLIFVIIILAILIGIIVPSLVFIGVGYIFSCVFKFSLFNAVMLCIASTCVFALVLFAIIYTHGRFTEEFNLEYNNRKEKQRKTSQKKTYRKIHLVDEG